MASVLRNLMAHSDDPDVRDSAIALMSTVVTEFWRPAAPVRVHAVGQNRPCVSDIMPLLLCSLRAADAQQQVNKRNCSTVFDIFSMLCENHPQQIALVNDMQFMPLLQLHYFRPLANGVDGVWHTAYNRLQAILTPP